MTPISFDGQTDEMFLNISCLSLEPQNPINI